MENFFNHFKWMKRQKGGRQTQKIKSFEPSLKFAETTLQLFHMQTLQIEINQLEMTLASYHT